MLVKHVKYSAVIRIFLYIVIIVVGNILYKYVKTQHSTFTSQYIYIVIVYKSWCYMYGGTVKASILCNQMLVYYKGFYNEFT